MQQADEITIEQAERDLEHSLLSSTYSYSKPFYKKVLYWITWPFWHPVLTIFLYSFVMIIINLLT